MLKVYEAIARELADASPAPLFGVMGTGNMLMIHHLVHRLGKPYIPAAREDGAVMMADGYARVSGQMGLATVTYGPSFANAFHALIESSRSRTPMLVLVGDTPAHDLRHLQRLDQREVARAAGARFHRVRSPSLAPTDARMACESAIRCRMPLVLDVAIDLQELVIADGPRRMIGMGSPFPSAPDPRAVDQALGILLAAQRPLILAGRGAVESGAGDALHRLADRLGVPVATTAKAKGFFRSHPLDLGICGSFAHPLAQEVLARRDVVIAFGASMSDHTLAALSDGVTVVQVDLDRGSPAARGRTPALEVIGDVLVTATMMLEWLQDADIAPRAETESLATRLAEHDPAADYVASRDPDRIDARTACLMLDNVLPPDRTLVVDGGHFMTAPMRYLSVNEARQFVFPVTFGSVGLGLGAAIGAAYAQDRPTVLAIGDGGWMMSLAEFATAVRERLDLIVVVFNDSAYGQEWHNLSMRGLDPSLAFHQWPSPSAMARGLGGEAYTVSSLDDRDALGKCIASRDGPLLIEVLTDPSVKFGVGD